MQLVKDFFDGKFDVFYASEKRAKNPALDGIVSEISLDIYCRPISLCGASLAGEIDTHMFSITLMEFIDLFSESPIRHYVGN